MLTTGGSADQRIEPQKIATGALLSVTSTSPAALETRKHRTGTAREDEHNAPDDRRRWFIEPRIYPGDAVPRAATLNAYLESVALEQTASRTMTPRLASPSRWQLLGPGNFSGRVNGIAVDPTNTQRLYVCTSSGGVWCTTDGGTSWSDIGASLGSNFSSTVTVDPQQPNVVYVATGDQEFGTQGAGLYRSTNHGGSFSLTALTTIDWASRIIVHPTNSSVVYAASNEGVHKSSDAGVTWTRTFTGYITDLVINPSTPNTLYCARYGDGVHKTTDGGATWTAQTGKPSAAFYRVRLALCNGSPANVYASYDVAGKVQIFRTTDAGATWAELPNPPDAGWNQLWYNHYIAVKPNNPNVIYSGQGTIFRSTNGGAGGGVGAGMAWQEINQPVGAGYTSIHVDHHCLAFDPVNPTTIYCGCDGGIYRSRFGGNYWEYIGASIPCSEFYAIGQGSQEHYEVGGGTQDNGTWLTDGSYNRWRHILGGDGFYLVVDPTNPSRLYAEWQGLNLNRSDDKGASFQYKAGGIMEADPKPWMGIIELDRRNPATLYVGTDRIYKTTNRMDNWSLLSCGDNIVLISPTKGANGRVQIDPTSTASAALGIAGDVQGTNDASNNPMTFARLVSTRQAPFALTNGMSLKMRIDGGALQTVTFSTGSFANIAAAIAREVATVIDAQTSVVHAANSTNSGFVAIQVAPSNSNVVYAAAAANQIWRSDDAGATWRSIRKPPLPDRWITDIDVAGNDANSVYLSVSGFGTPHVYHSPDGGANWVTRSTGLPDSPANSVVVDPTTPSRLWVATDTGVYVSTNSGNSWLRYSTDLPRVVSTQLRFHPNTGLLRVGTYGRGVWEIQATNPTVQITGARTASAGVGDMDHFRYSQDALALTLDIAATQDLLNLGLRFDATFQIISAQTNAVVRQAALSNSLFSWGPYFWISQGNNWGPTPNDYTTPERWGIARGVSYFRGTIAVQNGNAYAVSPRRWFRVV